MTTPRSRCRRACALVLLVALGATTMAPPASAVLGLAEDCTNFGVQVDVNSVKCATGGTCVNHGVVVWVGDSCWGSSPVGACASDVCVPDGPSGVPSVMVLQGPDVGPGAIHLPPVASSDDETCDNYGVQVNVGRGCGESELWFCAGEYIVGVHVARDGAVTLHLERGCYTTQPWPPGPGLIP